MSPLITVIVSVIVGIGASYITFRLQFERFESMDREREKHWVEWRRLITHDVEALKQSASLTQLALLTQTAEALTKRVEELAKYTYELKHMQVDPYVRAVDVLKIRVDELERDQSR